MYVTVSGRAYKVYTRRDGSRYYIKDRKRRTLRKGQRVVSKKPKPKAKRSRSRKRSKRRKSTKRPQIPAWAYEMGKPEYVKAAELQWLKEYLPPP